MKYRPKDWKNNPWREHKDFVALLMNLGQGEGVVAVFEAGAGAMLEVLRKQAVAEVHVNHVVRAGEGIRLEIEVPKEMKASEAALFAHGKLVYIPDDEP